MKHGLGTPNILITAATTSWRVLLTQWKKKLSAHLCNVECFVCSWLISETKWTCANVRVQFWKVEVPPLADEGKGFYCYFSIFQCLSPISVPFHGCTAK